MNTGGTVSTRCCAAPSSLREFPQAWRYSASGHVPETNPESRQAGCLRVHLPSRGRPSLTNEDRSMDRKIFTLNASIAAAALTATVAMVALLAKAAAAFS